VSNYPNDVYKGELHEVYSHRLNKKCKQNNKKAE